MDYRILPPDDMIEGCVALPLSKSVSARALILNALAGTPADIAGRLSDCDDTRLLADAVYAITSDSSTPLTLDLANAGTNIRFITALAAVTPGLDLTIEGQRRPVGPLVDALRQLGADITYLGEEGYPPLHIAGSALSGGIVQLDPTVSSQYVSALMMVAPMIDGGLVIDFEGECPAAPYVRMTAAMMAERGVRCDIMPLRVTVPAGQYNAVGPEWQCERDWTAASYWYELSALSAGWIELSDTQSESVQGDRAVARFFERLGVLTGPSEDNPGNIALTPSPETFSWFEADMGGNPDLVPAVAVTCAMLRVPFHITGIASLAHKECNRLEALRTELARVGCHAEIREGSQLYWDGRVIPVTELPVFDSHGDHRMAMALALTAAYIPGIVVRDAGTVTKSYPGFWEQLTSLGFTLHDPTEQLPDTARD